MCDADIGKRIHLFVNGGRDGFLHRTLFRAEGLALPRQVEWGFAVGVTEAAFAIVRNMRSCGLIARERVLSFQPKSGFDLSAFVCAPFIMALKVSRQLDRRKRASIFGKRAEN